MASRSGQAIGGRVVRYHLQQPSTPLICWPSTTGISGTNVELPKEPMVVELDGVKRDLIFEIDPAEPEMLWVGCRLDMLTDEIVWGAGFTLDDAMADLVQAYRDAMSFDNDDSAVQAWSDMNTLSVEDLRWRKTATEPPPYRTRVLVRYKPQWAEKRLYDVVEFVRAPHHPFRPGWNCECMFADPDYFPEWRPLPE